MGKQSWFALLLAMVLLVTTVPACAVESNDDLRPQLYAEDDYGGLAPPPVEEKTERTSTPPDENGGLAPTPAKTASASGKKQRESDKLALAGKVPAGVSLTTDIHNAYAYGSGGQFASFNPAREVTRAEAAQMIYRLLPEQAKVPSGIYEDVPETAWYADAVRVLADLGVMEAQDGKLDTGREVTRGEFIRYIACFFPLRTDAELFADVSEDDPNAPYIISARAYGWTEGGSDGQFHPDEIINRATVTVLLNRALGRTADKDYLARYHPTFYVDVSPSSWYYYDVLEATVGHSQTTTGGQEHWSSHAVRGDFPKDGFHLVDGWLYYYDSSRGDVVRNAEVQSHYFNGLGRFTTGNSELDSWLYKIVIAHTEPSQTQEEMLRSLYLYTRDSFTYLRRPPYEQGVYDYMETDALRILTTGYGNCYCYASLFWYLSRWIGYESVIYSGTVGSNRAPHSWVQITMDGKSYIYDTELEMAYRKKKRYDVNLYKFYDAKNAWNYRRPSVGGATM